MSLNKVIISGGGTGGHIFPAIAIANKIKENYPDCEILFVGAEGKMEMDKVPKAGYEIVGLPIRGLQRKLTLSNLAFPFKLWASLNKAKKLCKKKQLSIHTPKYWEFGGRIPWMNLKINAIIGSESLRAIVEDSSIP